MKATVQLSFKEKETGKQYKPGDTFEGTPERIAEINKALKGALKVIIADAVELMATEEKPKRKRRSKKA